MSELSIDFAKFPSTRYQGSKKKILPWIYECLKDLDFETALDAFGGSGSVSYLLKRMNKSVTYNDILKFNFYTGKAIIENKKIVFTEEDKKTVLSNNGRSTSIIQKNFKGIYFLDSENKWLDKVSSNILNMNHYSGTTLEYKKAIAYHALFQATLVKRPFNLFHRKNLSLRTADVPRTFGNKTTWETSFNTHFNSFLNETNSLIFDSKKRCSAINQSIFDIENVAYDLVYFDPPYLNKNGNNETSDYLRCYHFLEGLVNYSEWESLIDYNTINHRFANVNCNDYFKPDRIHKTFDSLLEKFQDSIIVLSYKKGGLPSIEHLVKTMRKYKKHVYTISQHYKYALNRQNGDAKKNREVLIIGI